MLRGILSSLVSRLAGIMDAMDSDSLLEEGGVSRMRGGMGGRGGRAWVYDAEAEGDADLGVYTVLPGGAFAGPDPDPFLASLKPSGGSCSGCCRPPLRDMRDILNLALTGAPRDRAGAGSGQAGSVRDGRTARYAVVGAGHEEGLEEGHEEGLDEENAMRPAAIQSV